MTLAPKVAVRDRPHRVTLQNPGPAVADGSGETTQSWTDLVPATLMVKIEAASAAVLERVTAGALIASATHIISGPYHPQVTTRTRMLFDGRVFSVKGVDDPEERHVDVVFICVEVVR